MEMRTFEVADSVQAYKCQREEQCDDCFISDHQKECDWCEQYDHTVRKLAVAHQPSAYPTDAPSVNELLSHLAGKTGVDLEPADESDADFIPGYDDGEAEPSNDEPSSSE
jgi:hypothetical protein